MKQVMRCTIILFALLSSYSAHARWNCTATCAGHETTLLDTIGCGHTPAEYSDFRAVCVQMGGSRGSGGSCHMCGTYETCERSERGSYTASGSGDTMLAARQATRAACTSANQPPNTGGNGCASSYRSFHLNESSFSCSE